MRRQMTSSRRGTLAVAGLTTMALLAACSGGDGGSLQNAGNTTVAPVTTTAGAGEPSTGSTTETTTPATSTTVATPLDSLPACNPEALAAATAPVEITFWHGMTADLEKALTALTDQYNASQNKVKVTLQNQGGYEQVIDKYLQSGQDSRPEMVQSPEYAVQVFRDTNSFVPVAACAAADGYDTAALLPSTVNAYSTGGVQWAMPFNVSNPVLYYNRKIFIAAGLDPDKPPRTLEDIEKASEQIVTSGAAKYGMVVDTSFDGGGGWYIEQWFAKAGEFYSDNANGRSAPAAHVLFNNATGNELLGFLQRQVANGWTYNVGDNTSGQDAFLKMADVNEPGAMTIATSAALGTVLAAIQGGLAPKITVDDIGVSPMPGPNGSDTVLVGGASLWIANDKGDEKTAATWDFIKFLVNAQSQSTWAAATGYVPTRSDAVAVSPLSETYATDPRFAVAYNSLLNTPDVATAVGPLLGPQREVRVLTARALATVLGGGDVATALNDAATQADLLLANYAATHSG